MLSNQIAGMGLNSSDMMRSSRNGHPTPYTMNMMFSANGVPQQSNPIMNISSGEFADLKDINDAPKPVKKPIFTEKGKMVFMVLIIGLAVYTIYKSHQAKKAEAQNSDVKQNVENQPADTAEVPEPPKPAETEIVDNSPKTELVENA